MVDYEYCSTSKIRVGGRQFNSIEGLIKSGYTKDKTKELVGNYVFWWEGLTVMFPDKKCSSAAFVECANKQVAVGYPARCFSYNLSSVKKALQFAEHINNAWLKFEGDWRIFLEKEMPQLEESFSPIKAQKN